MSLERRISLITLGVADVARSTEFYARLGWTKSSASNDQVTFIQLKGTALGLFSRASLAEDAHVADTPQGFSGITLAYNVSSEIGVDAVVKFAVSCGASLVKSPEKVFWGGYSGYVADPDGHLWEIAFNPFFPQDEHGHVVLPE
ncbi:MAG: VOC family protein [Agrobacterium albertimagni]|jgi:catechol 2,3-dioxygenase-like lactoylglutathione lyase family enzyme|uniref:Glyoxalase/bleomycin resistance protein/dioxygenase n=2 Tax=Agrobacterium albertimagni TaxID=147266 RepID=K2PC50_9HYPH|nr:VOC family protein [Agrobacterium albertimagni]EKF58468.1 glyoxalase/bleomycin resistance protein/dioxygenase [Agrobacterium albertimagni AOL15]